MLLEHIENIIAEGTGADRQLRVYGRTGELKAVVDHIVDETYQGLTVLSHANQPVPVAA